MSEEKQKAALRRRVLDVACGVVGGNMPPTQRISQLSDEAWDRLIDALWAVLKYGAPARGRVNHLTIEGFADHIFMTGIRP